jgi:hypothetical protein
MRAAVALSLLAGARAAPLLVPRPVLDEVRAAAPARSAAGMHASRDAGCFRQRAAPPAAVGAAAAGGSASCRAPVPARMMAAVSDVR